MKSTCITAEPQCNAIQRKFFVDLTNSARYVIIIMVLSESKYLQVLSINIK